jgi:hypothetical protein
MATGGIAEPGLKTVVGLELTKILLLYPLSSQQYLTNGSGQIVVNQYGENPAKELKGPDVRVKKSLLSLTGVEPDKVLPGKLAAHTEKLQHYRFPANNRHSRAPVNLDLTPGIRLTGDKDLIAKIKTKRYPPLPDITPNGGFTTGKVMLRHQPVKNSTAGMPLLPRLIPILLQPFINDCLVPAKHRQTLKLTLLVPPRLAPNGLLYRVP